jgi:hypothetical protein
MAKNKIRKFVSGGFSDLTSGVGPLPGYQSLTMAPRGQSGGAYGGLDTVNQGSQQIGQSLQTIGDALGKPGGGGSGLGGGLGGGLGSIGTIGGGFGSYFDKLNDFSKTLSGKPMKKGGSVKAKKAYKAGGAVKSSASKRADGCAIKGKTKGRMV